MSSLSFDAKREATPIVVVQGFLGTGIFAWEHHINKHNFHSSAARKRRILVPSLGPVSSLHDRACELFYTLIGGTVDYGADHSARHNHARYGRVFQEGLHPCWSRDRPLHFLGHSVGGPTIIKLQHLLHLGHFGKSYTPDIIRSVNAVCAPFRGTQVVYTLGESTTSAPAVRPLSIGAGLAKVVHVLAYLSPILPSSLDVHADARSLSYRESSLSEFVKHLWRSDWAESQDAAPYDMTFEAADDREASLEGRVYPNTYYRSHVSVMTSKINENPNVYHHQPGHFSLTHSVLYTLSKFMGTFEYASLQPPPVISTTPDPRSKNCEVLQDGKLESGIVLPLEPQGEEYWANDGVVPVFSQWHPHPCRATTCTHTSLENGQPGDSKILYPGRWIVHTTEDTNHASLLPVPFKEDVVQKRFWTELGPWLDAVDNI